MWLLEEQKAREIRQAAAAGRLPAIEAREAHRKAQDQEEQAARAADGRPRNMSIADGVAEIRVEGILTPRFDLIGWFFGEANTTYESIITSLSLAESDPNIKRVAWFVDSPGGMVDGLFETLAAIESFSKPMTVRASKAASAAYAIASAAGQIVAVSPASSFGSVGIVSSFYNDSDIIEVTSTEAPNKRPDVTTEEGKAVVRQYLDALHELFVDAIAAGRSKSSKLKVTAKIVNTEFGRGSMFVARDAKARNMIDKAPGALRAVRAEETEQTPGEYVHTHQLPFAAGAAPVGALDENTRAITMAYQTHSTVDGGGNNLSKEKRKMDIETLKAEHPAVYAAAVEAGEKQGIAKGREQGVTDERKRVAAHLNLGVKFGAMDIAIKAVKDGADFFDPEVQSEYMMAGANKRERDDKQTDSDKAGKALDGAKPVESTKDLGDLVADRLEKRTAVVVL